MANINQGVVDGVRRTGAKVRDLTVDGASAAAPLGFRLRGATTLGPPASGTWKAGDETRDRAGAIWICTAGGTPGTWVRTPPGGVTVQQFLAQPAFVVAHRGLPQVAPENTMPAFRSAVAAMRGAGYVPAVKIDVYTLADGSLAIMHDSAVDRMTTSTGNVATWTAAAWQTLQCPAGSLAGPAWPNVPVPLLTDFLAELGGKAVVVIEAKTGNSGVPAILTLITSLNLQSSCIMLGEDTTFSQVPLAKAAGVGYWYIWNQNPVSGPVTPAQAAAQPGVTGLGCAIDPFSNGPNYTDANITTIVTAGQAAGLPVHGFSYFRRASYTRAAGLGITGHVVSDLYAVTSAAQRTSDAFALGSPVPGDTGSFAPLSASPGIYGNTTPPTNIFTGGTGNWRRQINGNVPGGGAGLTECMGYLGPAAGLSSGGVYTIGLTVFWDAAETQNSLGDRFAVIMAGCADDTVYSGNPTVNGYGCLIRQGNGSSFSSPTFQVFKNTRGAYQNNGTYATGTAAQLGSNMVSTTGYAGPNTLAASYANGAAITSLTLGTAVTIPAGMKIALPGGQVATASLAATASTSVTISSLTLTSALAAGQAVQFGIPVTVKVDTSVGGQTTITFKRTDTGDTLTVTDASGPFSGGYFHIGKSGTGAGSTLAVSFAGITVS